MDAWLAAMGTREAGGYSLCPRQGPSPSFPVDAPGLSVLALAMT
jgi:hypothetical protein